MNTTWEYLAKERRRLAEEHPERPITVMASVDDISKYRTCVYVVKDYVTYIMFRFTGYYDHNPDCGFNAWGVGLFEGRLRYYNDVYFETGVNTKVELVNDDFWKFVENELKEKNIDASKLDDIKCYYWENQYIVRRYRRGRWMNEERSRKKAHRIHNIIIDGLREACEYHQDFDKEKVEKEIEHEQTKHLHKR